MNTDCSLYNEHLQFTEHLLFTEQQLCHRGDTNDLCGPRLPSPVNHRVPCRPPPPSPVSINFNSVIRCLMSPPIASVNNCQQCYQVSFIWVILPYYVIVTRLAVGTDKSYHLPILNEKKRLSGRTGGCHEMDEPNYILSENRHTAS